MNLVLNLTEHCNLRCLYCYYRENPSLRDMDLQTLQSSIDFAWRRVQQLGQNWLNITFFGGEPLLRKDLLRAGVDYALATRPQVDGKLLRLRFAINTNGTLLDDETYELLREHNFRVFLSVDGPASVHDTQRPIAKSKGANGTGSLAHITPWFARLQKLDTVVIKVIWPGEASGLANVFNSIKWLREQGFRRIATAPDLTTPWQESDLEELNAQYRLLADDWIEQRASGQSWYLSCINDKIRLQFEGRSCKQTTCNVLEGGLAISARGDVFPCTRFVSGSPDAPWKIGTVFTGLIAAKQDELQRYLHTDKEVCMQCSIKDRCQGNGCACLAFSTTGDIWGVSPLVCAHERMLAEICDEVAVRFTNL